ncbi:MAG TPA: zf-HC2 domain-containing protein [Pyrinomonadaceae bacterium]|nr:zf-HC2 domain-containing protein [Pyrinomonadaceae bacterium]
MQIAGRGEPFESIFDFQLPIADWEKPKVSELEIGNWKLAMDCDDIQQSLSLYVDDGLTSGEREACYRHLEVCPVCRAHVDQLRAVRRSLATLAKPAPPANLIPAINSALAVKTAELRARRNATTIDRVNDWALKWLQPRPMRYAFSSLASLVIFTAVFAALRPHMIALREATLAFDQIQLADDSDQMFATVLDINKPISPESYAALRTPYNTESPSLNPGGSLATLNWEPQNGAERQDDMVIVADVFMNGSASLANVVQAPRDRRMLQEFQNALQQDAAFVPASLDRRPETMRVVFSIQRVDVRERGY